MKLEIRTGAIKNAGCVSELSRKWLLRMFENEIAEVDGAISNERLWMFGADDEFTAGLHYRNIVDLSKYKVCCRHFVICLSKFWKVFLSKGAEHGKYC